jgi:NAD(P)-dependent dehydrogenase (short-subunit alcohol dehydrogenase family)
MEWNVETIGDLSDKIIIVTGGNSGLGFEAAKFFTKHNATVILACRSVKRATEAKNAILKEATNGVIDIMKLDLASLASIKSFVTQFKTKYHSLDVLLNNAGIMTVPYGLTEDGFELQNGINHLGHFALTAQLFDYLKNTPSSRIINISSHAHRLGRMDFSNYLFEHGRYGKLISYGRSKLSNLLFTYELDRRIKSKNIDVKVLAAHPGVASTNLGRYINKKGIFAPFFKMLFSLSKTAYQGALPEIRACLDPKAPSGSYYGPAGTRKKPLPPKIVKSSIASHSLKDAKRLWDLSEQLTKIHFDI